MPDESDQVSSMASSMTVISINAGVNDDDFEKFMKKEVFPTINLATRLFETRRHVLLRVTKNFMGRVSISGPSTQPLPMSGKATAILSIYFTPTTAPA